MGVRRLEVINFGAMKESMNGLFGYPGVYSAYSSKTELQCYLTVNLS